MELLNNWLIQIIIGNIVWIIFCKTVKWLYNAVTINNDSKDFNNSEFYSKKVILKQFKSSFYISSIATIILVVLLINNFQYSHPTLTAFLVVIIFLNYLFMLGAFEESFKYYPENINDRDK